MRMVEQSVVETVLFGRAFRENAGQKTENGVHQHHGGQFAPADHKVSDTDFLVDPVLNDSFVNALVVTAQ